MEGWKEEEEDRLSSWTLTNISGSGPSPADVGPDVSRADSRTGVWLGFAPRDALLRCLYTNRRATLRRRHAPLLFGRRDHGGVTRISDAASAGPLWCPRVTTTRTWLKRAGKSPAQVTAAPLLLLCLSPAEQGSLRVRGLVSVIAESGPAAGTRGV